MRDSFGRTITYLRLSVTDRCNLRCVYCMAEDAMFHPRAEVLSLEELERLAGAFIRLGVRKLRLTGGEPLVRRGIMSLIERLSVHLRDGRLDELTMTTNGTRLAGYARDLAVAGVRRVNVSLDSLDPGAFRGITRFGSLARVQEGIAAAKAAGLAVKINTVVLKGVNEAEIDRLISWCGEQDCDLTLIEVMPLGEMAHAGRGGYLPLGEVRRRLERRWTLEPSPLSTGGPARFARVAETGRMVGFITPRSHGFCAGCNRVRVTCSGSMHLCLGREDTADLRTPLRASEGDQALEAAILQAVSHKPKGHEFVIDRYERPPISRHMNVTGG